MRAYPDLIFPAKNFLLLLALLSPLRYINRFMIEWNLTWIRQRR